MSTHDGEVDWDMLAALGWDFTLAPFQPPALALLSTDNPDTPGREIIYDPDGTTDAYISSMVAHPIRECR